jgi:hypothetical protein
MSKTKVITTRLPVVLGIAFLSLVVIAGPWLEAHPGRGAGADIPRVKDPNFTFGLYVKNESLVELASTERQLGRKADLFLAFSNIKEQFNTEQAVQLANSGYRFVVTLQFWENKMPDDRFSLARITAGDWDPEIDAWAREVKAFGRPVILRPLHHANWERLPWSAFAGSNRVEDFGPAWRHVVDRFRAAGAANAQFELSFRWLPPRDPARDQGPMAAGGPSDVPWSAFWPGDNYVDIVGIDVLNRNWGRRKPATLWSFDDLFAEGYRQAIALPGNKPVWIQELATTGVGVDKAAWITDAFTSIRTKYPRVSSVTWLNHSLLPNGDFEFDETPASLAAMRQALNSPLP